MLHSIWTRHGTEDFLGSDWTRGCKNKEGSLRSELLGGSTLRDPDNFNGLEPDGWDELGPGGPQQAGNLLLGLLRVEVQHGHLANGLNIWDGKVTCEAVAEALGYESVPIETALAG